MTTRPQGGEGVGGEDSKAGEREISEAAATSWKECANTSVALRWRRVRHVRLTVAKNFSS